MMHRWPWIVTGLLILLATQEAAAARFKGQFDLICKGKFSDSHEWNKHFAVDIGQGLYCSVDTGGCNEMRSIRIVRNTPTSLVLGDHPAIEGTNHDFRDVLSVNSKTNEMTGEAYKPEGIVVFARAACRRAAFTPSPALNTPGVKPL